MDLRNLMFRLTILSEHSFGIQVITVGNLGVGGNGKTPCICWLVNMLGEENVAVLSRGYGRRGKEFLWVEEQGTAEEFGDEPLMIKQYFPGLSVAVCADRVAAIQRIQQERPQIEYVLLDDGFQHRKVKPSLSILLTTQHRPFFKDLPIPAGRLREFAHNYRRADAVIVTKCTGDLNKGLFESRIKSEALFYAHEEYRPMPLRQVYGFSGLADDRSFKKHLETKYELLGYKAYPDHHHYTRADLEEIKKAAGELSLVCTAKDAVKINNLDPSIELHVIELRMAFESEDFKHWLRAQLDES